MYKTKLKALGKGHTTQTANKVQLGNPGQRTSLHSTMHSADHLHLGSQFIDSD